MSRFRRLLGLSGLLVAGYLLAWPVGLEPEAWQAPRAVAPIGPFAPNDDLASCQVFARAPGKGPDSLAIDGIGYLYTGLADGRILRISPDGRATETLAVFDGRATGIAFDTAGDLLVADERGGTVYALEDDGGLVPLLRDLDGEPLLLINDLAVGNDGTIYVTESSTRYTLEQLRHELLEHRPNGRILAYSPVTRRARIVRDGLYFPNGIVVSPDQSSLVYAETTAYRVSRLWIHGPKAGTVEPLLTALPGFPGDVSVSENGRYWLSLLAPRNALLDSLAAWPKLRLVLARLPRWLSPTATPLPYLIAFDASGRVERTLQSETRRDLPSFSSVLEYGNALFLGTPGIGSQLDGDLIYRIALPQDARATVRAPTQPHSTSATPQ